MTQLNFGLSQREEIKKVHNSFRTDADFVNPRTKSHSHNGKTAKYTNEVHTIYQHQHHSNNNSRHHFKQATQQDVKDHTPVFSNKQFSGEFKKSLVNVPKHYNKTRNHNEAEDFLH